LHTFDPNFLLMSDESSMYTSSFRSPLINIIFFMHIIDVEANSNLQQEMRGS